MNENSKVLLIDGHSIANRAFYGLPDLTNSQGVHTNAVLGFLNIFLNVFNQLNPEYVVVAFDRHEPTFRHEMFKEYKGTRKAMPEELRQQIPLIKEALSAMNITTAELAGFEADDLLGSYSVLAEKDGHEVYILSGDRDLLQLATDKTMIIIPKTKSHGTEIEKYYAADVKEKYGVTPSEFIDMKALMGDSSDNIPGIPGIGEKTAANIIMQFHSLENAIEHVEEINPKKARENLIAFEEQGRMSKVLAKIDTAAPVPADFHNATVESQAVFFNSVSYEFFKKLELKKLLEKFDSVPTDTVSENIDIEVRDIESFEKDLENQHEFGLFIDSDSTLTAVSYGEKNYIYKGVPENILNILSGKTVFCFDLKNLLHILDADDLESDKIYDLSLMAYLLNPLLNSYSFDGIAKDYLDRIVPSQADLIGKKSIKDSM
ncbi:MAG: DNA polymerase I, partial [Parasporobacterium sp.]|nr:DNA polymerase I [Parasporobacterium sp.]